VIRGPVVVCDNETSKDSPLPFPFCLCRCLQMTCEYTPFPVIVTVCPPEWEVALYVLGKRRAGLGRKISHGEPWKPVAPVKVCGFNQALCGRISLEFFYLGPWDAVLRAGW